MKSFRSDNYSGVHPEIMQAIIDSNLEHAPSYLEDFYTIEANKIIKKNFTEDCKIIYCFNGTAANVLALRACTKPYQSIICSDVAHINKNETGAIESLVGSKLIGLAHQNGKITAQQIEDFLKTHKGIHEPQPKVVSIAQATEAGTVYTTEEIKAIKEVCVKNKLYLHVDGCRIFNAAVFLDKSLAEISCEIGVDILSLGGTKNGAMMAEAVLVFNKELFDGVEYLQKNTLQLYSKNRFLAAQYLALFKNNLWQRNAENANKMASLLASKLTEFSEVIIVVPCESNQLFLMMPLEWCKVLQEKYFCYVWMENPPIVRVVCSFDSTEDDVNSMIEAIRELKN